MKGVLKACVSFHGYKNAQELEIEVHTFNLSARKQWQVDLSKSLRSAWSLLLGLSQSELCRDFVSKKEKQKTEKKVSSN